MKRKAVKRPGAAFDFFERPVVWRSLAFLVVAGFGIWTGWPAVVALMHGSAWTDTVFTGTLKNGRMVYWHIWFTVPFSVALVAFGVSFLFWGADAPKVWGRVLTRSPR